MSEERMTNSAREAISFAETEAVRAKHPRVGTEHLLLGLLHQRNTVAYTAMARLTYQRARGEFNKMTPPLDSWFARKDRLKPFSQRLTIILDGQSVLEADALQDPQIGCEHLLLAILSDPECMAVKLLQQCDLSPTEIRDEVLRLLGKTGEPAPNVYLAEHGLAALEGLIAVSGKDNASDALAFAHDLSLRYL